MHTSMKYACELVTIVTNFPFAKRFFLVYFFFLFSPTLHLQTGPSPAWMTAKTIRQEKKSKTKREKENLEIRAKCSLTKRDKSTD